MAYYTGFPNQGAPIINPSDGTLTETGYRFLLQLWQRTGGLQSASYTGAIVPVGNGATYSIPNSQNYTELASGQAINVGLPGTPIPWFPYVIFDASGIGENTAIIIYPSSGTINGSASFQFTKNYQSVACVFDNTNWWIT